VHLVKFDAAISPMSSGERILFFCLVQYDFESALCLRAHVDFACYCIQRGGKTLFDAVRPEEAAFLIFFCRNPYRVIARLSLFLAGADTRVANQRRNCTLI